MLSIFFALIAANNLYANPDLSVPTVVLTDVAFSISVSDYDSERACDYRIELEESLIDPSFCAAGGDIKFEFLRFVKATSESVTLILDENVVSEAAINVLPGWVSLLPPVVSILMALVFRSVVPALFRYLDRVLCNHGL